MLRTASSLPLTGLLTLGSGPARFQTKPPACYRASWQLPGPDFHRQATTSLRTRRTPWHYVTVSPPVLLGARENLNGGMSLAPARVLREGDRGPLRRLPQMFPGSQPRAATSAEPQPDAVLAAAAATRRNVGDNL
jgi:hypothetical protein